MVGEPLVVTAVQLPQSAIDRGRDIVEELDRNQIPVSDAFWRFKEETQAWQLIITTDASGTLGPKHIYGVLQGILGDMSDTEKAGLEVTDIVVTNPVSLLARLLRRGFGKGQSEDPRRARRVDDPYIYRLS